MFKLLNRFAWLISLSLALQISFIFDKHGPLNDDGFFWFIIPLIIIKFIILSNKFIKNRLEFFADQLLKREKGNNKNKAVINKAEQIQKIEKNDDIDKIFELDSNIQIKEKEFVKKQKKSIKNLKNKKKTDNFVHKQAIIVKYFKDFFSENLLAKIGSILVFLGVLFLMSLIWNEIPNIIKIIIGFVIGFGMYFIGVWLDKKGYKGESRILLGTGILINFLVILAGRYLIGSNFGDGTDGVLGIGITFIFLILNTVFGVLTSFIYKSRILLIFSFIFAYLNPFLIGEDIHSSYVLVGYSMLISIGALFIGIKQNDKILKLSAFIFGNILILLANFTNETGFILQLLSSGILGIITIFSLFNKDSQDKNIGVVFVLNYIFIIILLFWGGINSVLGSSISYISYMIAILLFFGVGIFLVVFNSLSSIIAICLFPLLIVFGLIVSGITDFIIPSLGLIVISFLIGFSFLNSVINNISKYLFFIFIGIFIFGTNCYIGFNFGRLDLSFSELSFTVIISFIFLFTSYYLSRKEDLEYLYTIGTVGGIATLIPLLIYEPIRTISDGTDVSVLTVSNKEMILSIISVIIFAVSNQLLPFFNRNLRSKNLRNLIIGSIFGVLFISWELFVYGNKYFPGVSLGLTYGGLAIFFFILGFLMMKKIGIEKIKREISSKNTILSYFFVSISIFSLAIALVFSKHSEVISTLWLFEASILFYFYNKLKEFKIYIFGIILFFIGNIELINLFDVIKQSEFIFLIPFGIILCSYIFNIKNLDFENLNSENKGLIRISHDVVHILGILILGNIFYEIIPDVIYGWGLLGLSIFVFAIGIIYSYFNSEILKYFFLFCFGGLILSHIGNFNMYIYKIDRFDLNYLRILQYFSTIILGLTIIFWNKFNKINIFNNIIKGLYAFYLLVIVSYYVEDIFNTTFAVTIFWGAVASIGLLFGITKDIIKYRTIGLYLLSLVLTKIFIYDLWVGINDAVSRVLALIGIGVLLIIISLQYSKRYGNNLKGEFSVDNLLDKK